MIRRSNRQQSPGKVDAFSFRPLFPSPTAGNGEMKANNARPGKDQPDAKPSQRRKVACKNCGFPADLSRHANDGGSLDGDGAGGNISVTATTGHGYASDQAYRKGAGCPLCHSRNFAKY